MKTAPASTNVFRPVDSLNRRDLLRFGGLGLIGSNIAWSPQAGSAATTPASASRLPRIKSCILIFYFGGPSHIDLWDMKPDAPSNVRGEFQSIPTSLPGFRVCEHLPRTARIANRLTVIRSMHHRMRDHNAAAVEALCGRAPLKGDLTFLVDDANSFPCYGAALSYLAPHRLLVPAHVALPHIMHRTVKLPGQGAGFLGSSYGPLQIERDPNDPDFRVEQLELPDGLALDRLESRRMLRRGVERRGRSGASVPNATKADANYERAFSMLTSEPLRDGFDLSRESGRVRDRYGRNKHGQSVLLARRLVERGVRFVNVNNRQFNGSRNWDTHYNNFGPLKDGLLPPADHAFSALIEDLESRGLLESTLVIAMGEFGRTPRINKYGARDHWPDCYTVLLAGGGAKAGLVYGSSDNLAARPDTNPVTPGDLAATLYWRFGLDHRIDVHDLDGRPSRLAVGEPLRHLFERTA